MTLLKKPESEPKPAVVGGTDWLLVAGVVLVLSGVAYFSLAIAAIFLGLVFIVFSFALQKLNAPAASARTERRS